MPAIDFREIPAANTSAGEQDQFEFFSRDFLQMLGYHPVTQPNRGADGGKDFIVEEVRSGVGGETRLRWLVSCKHLAHSGGSVKPPMESDIRDRVEAHACNGFIGFYSTLPSSGLDTILEGLKNRIEVDVFDRERIERNLLGSEEGLHLARRYFPESAATLQMAKREVDEVDAPNDQEIEAALVDYRARLERELKFVPYRGISGLGTAERVVELPIDEVYVVPGLLTESQHTHLGEQERTLVEQLSDPDLGDVERANLEVKHAEIAFLRWNAQYQDAQMADIELPYLIRASPGARVEAQKQIVDQRTSEMLRSQPQCIILGAPGAGKSILLRWIALRCARGELAEYLGWSSGENNTPSSFPVEMPLVVSLAGYAQELQKRPQLSLKDYLKEHVHGYGGPSLVAAFKHMFEKGLCWFLFDGIDEAANGTDRATVVKRIDAWLLACGSNRCLITSRPHGYTRISGGISHYYLDNFTSALAVRFVSLWHLALERWQHPEDPDLDKALEEARNLLGEIRDNERVRALATNPLMLVIMALIHREKKHLPERRVELYDSIVNTLLNTWNYWRSTERYDAGGVTLPRFDLLRVLGKVAVWARREKSTGVMPRAELRRQIVRALEELELAENNPEATAESYLNAIVEQAGIMEERVPNIFAFWHPTFEEFLAARELTIPTSRCAEQLLPLRPDPRWREVILLAIGYLGAINGDGETAAEVVSAIADSTPDMTEPLIHRNLRLAVACLQENPYLKRSLAQTLLTRLANVITHQPYEPMGGNFRDVVNALPRMVPNGDLILSLEEMIRIDHTRGSTRTAALLLLANAAPSSERARQICWQICKGEFNKAAETDADQGSGFLPKDGQARLYAASGLIRAGEITQELLTYLVWPGETFEHVAVAADLIGIMPSDVGTSNINQAKQLLATMHSILRTEQEQPSSLRSHITGRLSVAILLLLAGEGSSEGYATLLEALQPENDDNGAVFDAAQAVFLFKISDEYQKLGLQRAACQALTRWLIHSVPVRRFYSARMLLEIMQQWGPASKAYAATINQDLSDPQAQQALFQELYQIKGDKLHAECIEAYISCLHISDWTTCLLAAEELLSQGQLDSVLEAMPHWMDEDEKEFPHLSVLSLVDALASHPDGYSAITSWLHHKNDWLRMLSSSVLLHNEQYTDEALEVKWECLSSNHDEIRSTAGRLLAMIAPTENGTLSPRIEKALRSCFGSPMSDASRNAASALYMAGVRDEDVCNRLTEYMLSQQIGERFATYNAYREEMFEEDLLNEFLEAVQSNWESAKTACDTIRLGQTLSGQDQEELLELTCRQPEEDHSRYVLRRFFFDWLWWSLEMRSQLNTASAF